MKLISKIWEAIARFVGDIRWAGIAHPFWFIINAHGYKLKGEHYRTLKKIIQPGDILVRRFDGYVSNFFLPGYWGHAGIYVGGKAEQIVHSLSEGVIIEDVLNFMRSDYLIVFRPPQKVIKEGIEKAKSIVGSEYDFAFDFDDSEKFVCTEVICYCYPGLVTTVARLGKNTVTADDVVRQLADKEIWDSRRIVRGKILKIR